MNDKTLAQFCIQEMEELNLAFLRELHSKIKPHRKRLYSELSKIIEVPVIKSKYHFSFNGIIDLGYFHGAFLGPYCSRIEFPFPALLSLCLDKKHLECELKKIKNIVEDVKHPFFMFSNEETIRQDREWFLNVSIIRRSIDRLILIYENVDERTETLQKIFSKISKAKQAIDIQTHFGRNTKKDATIDIGLDY